MRLPRRAVRHLKVAYGYLQRTSGDRAQNMERAIALLARALEALDPALHSQQWARTQNDLASAYTDRVLGDQAENLEAAITHYMLALDVDPAICEAGEWGSFHANLAMAYRLRVRGGRAQNVDNAIAHYEQALEIFTHDDHPESWAQLQHMLGMAYSDRVNGDHARNAEDAIDHMRNALAVFTPDTHPEQWAGICGTLGLEYGDRTLGDRAQNLEDAIAFFKQALQVYTPNTNPLVTGGIHSSLGAVYLNRVRGEPGRNAEAAVQHLGQAVELLGDQNYDESSAETEARLGIAYLKLPGLRDPNVEQAIVHLSRAVAFLSVEPASELTAMARDSLGYGYINRSRGDPAQNIEQAIPLFEAAVAISGQLGDQQGCITSNLNLAAAHLRRIRGDQAENAEQAMAFLDRVLNIRSRSADPDGWAEVQVDFGIAYRERPVGDRAQNLQKAMEYCRQALEVYGRDTAPVEWARVQGLLGDLYARALLGDRAQNLEQAIEHCERALEVYTRNACPAEWASTQVSLGEVWSKRLMGESEVNFANAITRFHQALDVYTREAYPTEWARTENQLGIVYLEDLRRAGFATFPDAADQAMRHFRRALEVYTVDAYPERHATVTSNLGFASVAQGGRPDDVEQAIRELQRSLEVLRRDVKPELWAGTHINLGLAYYRRVSGDRSANLSRSAEHLGQALEVCTPEVFPAQCRVAAELLARTYFDSAAWPESLAAFDQAILAGEALLASAYTEHGRRAEASETSHLHAQAVWCLLKLRRPGEALQRLEAGKARLLAEALALGDVDLAVLPEAERTAIHSARNQVHALEADIRRDQPPVPGDGSARVAEQLRVARADLLQVLQTIRQERPGLLPTGAAEQEILRLVPPGGALVAPVVTSKGGAAFVLPHDTKEVSADQVLDLPSLTESALGSLLSAETGMARLYSFDQEDDNSRLLDTPTAQLWELLMGRIHDRLVALGLQPGAPITLVPQGGLALLPLHAAWRVDKGQRRYILDDWTLTYSPSAYALMMSRRRLSDPRRRELSLLAVADPTGDLPHARHEVDDVSAEFVADRCQILRGPDATRARLLEAASGHSYLHLACHGAYNWADPMASHLMLAGRDPFTLAEIISDLDLERARLVALSACETGLTDRAAPDEYFGLPAGFLQAGAPAVLASLWPVSDLSTSLLIGRFYRHHLGDHHDPATALREAQLWLREARTTELRLGERWELEWRRSDDPAAFQAARYWRAHPDEVPFAHPYHWASFICVGE
jgi:CHAT domain-containing protein/tetratricopeptide (TPR) repeat protein